MIRHLLAIVSLVTLTGAAPDVFAQDEGGKACEGFPSTLRDTIRTSAKLKDDALNEAEFCRGIKVVSLATPAWRTQPCQPPQRSEPADHARAVLCHTTNVRAAADEALGILRQGPVRTLSAMDRVILASAAFALDALGKGAREAQNTVEAYTIPLSMAVILAEGFSQEARAALDMRSSEEIYEEINAAAEGVLKRRKNVFECANSRLVSGMQSPEGCAPPVEHIGAPGALSAKLNEAKVGQQASALGLRQWLKALSQQQRGDPAPWLNVETGTSFASEGEDWRSLVDVEIGSTLTRAGILQRNEPTEYENWEDLRPMIESDNALQPENANGALAFLIAPDRKTKRDEARNDAVTAFRKRSQRYTAFLCGLKNLVPTPRFESLVDLRVKVPEDEGGTEIAFTVVMQLLEELDEGDCAATAKAAGAAKGTP